MWYDPQIERDIARARMLRAQYLAHLVSRAWTALLGAAHGAGRRFYAMQKHVALNQKTTVHSAPPGAAG